MGWRRQIEQAYRFEVALELVDQCSAQRVLDVGCGVGALAAYAHERGVDCTWLGIEPRPDFVTAARESGRYSQVFDTVFSDVAMPDVDVAVAIGVLTSTSNVDVEQLSQYLRQAPASVFTVLNRASLSDRPLLAAEHSASASTLTELRAACVDATIVEITSTDFAVVHASTTIELRTVTQRYEATLSGPWGRVEPAEKAWLACELGLRDDAMRWLDECPPGDLADLVRQRLRLS